MDGAPLLLRSLEPGGGGGGGGEVPGGGPPSPALPGGELEHRTSLLVCVMGQQPLANIFFFFL